MGYTHEPCPSGHMGGSASGRERAQLSSLAAASGVSRRTFHAAITGYVISY